MFGSRVFNSSVFRSRVSRRLKRGGGDGEVVSVVSVRGGERRCSRCGGGY